MTILDYIDQYRTSLEAGIDDDKVASTIVDMAEKLFKTASTGQRLKAEQEWYVNERYLEGDHWLKFDRKTGTITYPKQQKRVRRDINLARKQLRALKNFILAQRFTWEVSPEDDSPEASDNAKQYNQVLSSYVYDLLDVPMKLYDVLTNGIVKRFGSWELVWDDESDNLRLSEQDSFDVYPDPSVRNPRDGQFLFKTSKVSVAKIKKNAAYFERRSQVSGDNREAASDFKDSLEKYRGTTGENQSLDEAQTSIAKELFLKRDDGTQCLIAYADGKLLRADDLNIKRFPLLFYFPERNNHGLYGSTWFRDIRVINRIFENVISIAEDYVLKIKPKLMRPKGSSMKPITDELGDFLEYSQAIPDQIKEFMPAGLPSTHFNLMDLARDLIEDVGGMHTPATRVPNGVTSGRAIEALQAADENNVGEPKQMLERFLEETGELALELISAHQVTKKTVTRYDGKTTFRREIMGSGGVPEDGQVPDNVLVVKPLKVNVSIVPAVAYTEEGRRQTALDLYKAKLIDRETALDTYRFSNIGDVVRKAEAEQAKEKAQSAPPPPPVPADKLMQGLAALAKSGEPVTFAQVQETMRQAGLPPLEEQEPAPQLQPAPLPESMPPVPPQI